MKQYNVGIVGCGARSADHIDAYNYIDNAKVAACCDCVKEKRDSVAGNYKVNAYEDISTMASEEQIDIIHLITWPKNRIELMTEVSENNIPMCIIEKPIATGVADWEKLCQLEASSNTKFAVSHQVRWHQDLKKCQDALSSGKLGDILFLDISAGMNISGQGTHTLNYGRSLIGDPIITRVFGQIAGWDVDDTGHPAPLCSEAMLQFDNGCRALWTSGPVSPRCGDPDTTWQHVRVAAYAETGRVKYEEFNDWEIISNENMENGNYGGMETWAHNNVISQSGLSKAMLQWHENGIAPGTNLKVSLHEWAVILALYESAVEHSPIEMLNYKPNPDLLKKIMKDR